MTDFETVDFFTDESLVPNPYPYFDHLRSKCPVAQATPFNVLAVTGYDEALAVYKDPAFSSCVSVAGPFSGMPFGPDGHDDVSELIEEHRGAVPMAEHITSQDPPLHTRTRGLMNKLITPKRLKENEEFMWRLADQQLDTFIDRGQCEFLADYAKPFSLLGDRRPARRARRGPRRVQGGLRARDGRRVGQGGADVAQSAAMAQRQVLRLHRGPQARAARGRADRVGAGQVRRRIDAGHRGRHEPVDVLVRRRNRDDDQAGQLGGTDHRREPGVREDSARGPQQDWRFPRRDAADGKPGQVALPDGPHDDHRRRCQGARGHDRHGAAGRVQS